MDASQLGVHPSMPAFCVDVPCSHAPDRRVCAGTAPSKSAQFRARLEADFVPADPGAEIVLDVKITFTNSEGKSQRDGIKGWEANYE